MFNTFIYWVLTYKGVFSIISCNLNGRLMSRRTSKTLLYIISYWLTLLSGFLLMSITMFGNTIDFSDTVDQHVLFNSNLDSIETNLKFWVMGDNIDGQNNSTLTNGQSIAQWNDYSGSTNNALQNTANNQGIYNHTLSSIRFDGPNDFYSIGTNITTNSSYTFFIVEKRAAGKAQNYYFGQTGSAGRDKMIHLGYRTDSSITLAHFSNDITTDVRNHGNVDLAVFRFKRSESPSHFINFNGPLLDSGQSGTALTNNGYNIVGSSFENFYNGNIMEIIIFNTALSDSQVSTINYYLSMKWGLQTSVDSNGNGVKDNSDPLYKNSRKVIQINSQNGNNYNITSNTAGIVGSGNTPPLTLEKGETYIFEHLASGHPLKIVIGAFEKVINAGDVVPVTIPSDQTGSNYYFCTAHPVSMQNVITFQTLPTSIVPLNGIAKPNTSITIPIVTSGNVEAGKTYSYQILPAVSGASIISDPSSSSGYSLRYTPPNNLDPLTEKTDISIVVSDQNSNIGPSVTSTIYFFNEFTDPDFKLSVFNPTISISDNEPLNSEIHDVNNDINFLDSVDSFPIQYTISSNDFFNIHPSNGKITLKSNSFSTNQVPINVTVNAVVTTNSKIIGVYSRFTFEVFASLDLLTDTNNNGIPDALERDDNGNGIPDEFETGEDEFILKGDIDFVIDEQNQALFNDISRELSFDDGIDMDLKVNAKLKEVTMDDASMDLEAELEVEDFILGGGSGGNAQFTMSDPNGVLNVKDDLTIGENGKGTARFSQGSASVKGTLTIGNNSNSGGVVYFSENANFDIEEDFVIGSKGEANVNASGGDLAVKGSMSLGKDSNSKAQVNISNTATIKVAKDLTIGESGDAEINCSGGNLNVAGKISLTGKKTSVIKMTGGVISANEIDLNDKESFKFEGGSLSTKQINGSFESNGGTLDVGPNADNFSGSGFQSRLRSQQTAQEKLKNITKIVGDFVQKEGITKISNLSLKIYSAAQNSQIEVTGKASLAGTLNLTSSTGLAFKLKQSFQLIKAKVIEGSFSKITLPTLSSDLKWNTSNLYTNGTISVEQATSQASVVATILSYPNPVLKRTGSPTFHYKLKSASDVTMKIYNIFGGLIYSKSFRSTENGGQLTNSVALSQLVTNRLPIGIYFILIHDQSNVVAKGKFAVK